MCFFLFICVVEWKVISTSTPISIWCHLSCWFFSPEGAFQYYRVVNWNLLLRVCSSKLKSFSFEDIDFRSSEHVLREEGRSLIFLRITLPNGDFLCPIYLWYIVLGKFHEQPQHLRKTKMFGSKKTSKWFICLTIFVWGFSTVKRHRKRNFAVSFGLNWFHPHWEYSIYLYLYSFYFSRCIKCIMSTFTQCNRVDPSTLKVCNIWWWRWRCLRNMTPFLAHIPMVIVRIYFLYSNIPINVQYKYLCIIQAECKNLNRSPSHGQKFVECHKSN